MAIGFTLPFSRSSGSVGYFETTSDEVSAVKENLRSLLLTNWGERVNHFYMGCNLKEFLFENVEVDEMRAKVADRVLSQVETWLPFVTVQNLNVLLTEDDATIPENGVKIRIDFILSAKPDLSSRLEQIVAR